MKCGACVPQGWRGIGNECRHWAKCCPDIHNYRVYAATHYTYCASVLPGNSLLRCDASSPYIHPVGFCEEAELTLTTPAGKTQIKTDVGQYKLF